MITALISIFLSFSNFTNALELTPMEVEFSSQGTNASHIFSVENKFTKDIAVELKIYKRRINAKGEEVRDEANDFLIFPRQIKLAPGQKRPVRVSWTGPAEVKKEIPYRLVLEQLPIDFKRKEKEAQKIDIDFLLKYVASVYVVPENAKSEVIVENVKSRQGRLLFTLKNSGSKHLVISKFSLSSENKEITLPAKSLQQVLGKNILCDSALDFNLPWPADLKSKNLVRVKVHVE